MMMKIRIQLKGKGQTPNLQTKVIKKEEKRKNYEKEQQQIEKFPLWSFAYFNNNINNIYFNNKFKIK